MRLRYMQKIIMETPYVWKDGQKVYQETIDEALPTPDSVTAKENMKERLRTRETKSKRRPIYRLMG